MVEPSVLSNEIPTRFHIAHNVSFSSVDECELPAPRGARWCDVAIRVWVERGSASVDFSTTPARWRT